MLIRYLILLFIGLPMLELLVILQIGQRLGILPTFLLVILTGIAGAFLAKSQGISAWNKIHKEFARGHIPGEELMDGLMIFAGGITLLTPGLITDTLGLCLLIPFTRKYIKAYAYKFIRARISSPTVIIDQEPYP